MQVSAVVESDNYAIVGGRQAQSFRIGQSAHAFKILSDALYSDKFRAVAREVICNAVDAHIAADIDRPISITLTEQELIIRDFGLGIADDRMIDIYATYFGSTKIDDDNQTGGFGLGSKSPFAYTEHFTVESCHKGMKRIYALHIGDNDTGGTPAVRLMAAVACGEDQGVAVKIPLAERHDHIRFQKHIEQVIRQGGMKVELNGELLDTNDWTDLKRVGFAAIINRYDCSKETFVLYGNVRYPIGYNSAIDDLKKKLEHLCPTGYSFLLYAPPSSMTVTPSRESIGYSPRTIYTVTRLMKRALHEIERYRPQARMDIVAKALEGAERVEVAYKLNQISDLHRRGADKQIVVDGYDIARQYELWESDHQRFYDCAKKLTKAHRRGLVAINKPMLATDQLREVTRKLFRIMAPAKTFYRLYIYRGRYPINLSPLRKKPESGRYPTEHSTRLIFAKTREEGIRFGGSGFYIVAPKISPNEMMKITEIAFRNGFTVNQMISAPKVKAALKPKREKTSENLFSPLNFDHHCFRGQFGNYSRLPTAIKIAPEAYIALKITRSPKYGVIVKTDYDLRELSERVADVLPNVVVAVSEKEIEKLKAAGVPTLESLVLQKLEERIARHEYLDTALTVMNCAGSLYTQAELLVRNLKKINLKLGLLGYDLPLVENDPTVDALWKVAEYLLGANAAKRSQTCFDDKNLKELVDASKTYEKLTMQTISAAPAEYRERIARLINKKAKESDFAHMEFLGKVLNQLDSVNVERLERLVEADLAYYKANPQQGEDEW